MIQDTLQRLRGKQTSQSTTAASTAATATSPMVLHALSVEQQQAMAELLTALDVSANRKFIGLFGLRGSGKTTLLNELARDSVRGPRTPQHRKVVCAVVNALTLPTDLEPWQRLVFATLDKLAQQPGAPQTVADLRSELEELIALEQRKDDSASLAGAAFAHHFRAAFTGIVHSCISLSNATLVVAIDHIDKTSGDKAAQLLEASRYFLNAQNCTTLICADADVLLGRLGADGDDVLSEWLSGQVVLKPSTLPKPEPATQPITPKAPPKPIASDIPQPCVQLMTEALANDRYGIERAGESWRGAMRALARRNADGYDTKITAVMIAKLAALKQLSPALFDAARFDAPLLITLERRARAGASSDIRDEWSDAMLRDARLVSIFTSAPSFIGAEPRDLATALRLVHAGESEAVQFSQPQVLSLEPAQPRVTLLGGASAGAAARVDVQAVAVDTPAARPQRERAPMALPSLPTSIWVIISVAAGAFIVDRLVKLAIQAGAVSFGALVQPVPLNSATVVGSALGIGMELIGLALCALVILFWGAKTHSMPRAAAFGLIGGGLMASIFDRVAYGSVMNYLHIGNLPVFNLAHVALVAGALLLGYAILANNTSESEFTSS